MQHLRCCNKQMSHFCWKNDSLIKTAGDQFHSSRLIMAALLQTHVFHVVDAADLGLTSVYQTSWSLSPESHGWHSLPSFSWPPVYLQPSLLTQRRKVIWWSSILYAPLLNPPQQQQSEHFEKLQLLLLCCDAVKILNRWSKSGSRSLLDSHFSGLHLKRLFATWGSGIIWEVTRGLKQRERKTLPFCKTTFFWLFLISKFEVPPF